MVRLTDCPDMTLGVTVDVKNKTSTSTLVTKILHCLKLKYKESNLQDEPPCSNVPTLQTGSLTFTWDACLCIREVGVGA